MADFKTGGPAPQGVEPTTKSPDESGTPVTGFTEAPSSERAPNGPGDGVPPSRRVIH